MQFFVQSSNSSFNKLLSKSLQIVTNWLWVASILPGSKLFTSIFLNCFQMDVKCEQNRQEEITTTTSLCLFLFLFSSVSLSLKKHLFLFCFFLLVFLLIILRLSATVSCLSQFKLYMFLFFSGCIFACFSFCIYLCSIYYFLSVCLLVFLSVWLSFCTFGQLPPSNANYEVCVCSFGLQRGLSHLSLPLQLMTS